MELDHVAVPSLDIAASVEWYVKSLGAEVLYQDATWAFLKLGQGKLALVTPTQHPPHMAIRVDEATLELAAQVYAGLSEQEMQGIEVMRCHARP